MSIKISAMTVYSGPIDEAYIPIILPSGGSEPWANYRMLASALQGDGGGEGEVEVENGLYESLYGIIRWGGELTEPTAIDQNDHVIVIHSGNFKHGTGDYIDFLTPYSILEDGDAYFNSARSDAAGTDVNILGTLASGGQVNLQAFNPAGASTITISGLGGIYISNSNGQVIIANLSTYANEAAAVTAGLAQGQLYQTATGELRIKL